MLFKITIAAAVILAVVLPLLHAAASAFTQVGSAIAP